MFSYFLQSCVILEIDTLSEAAGNIPKSDGIFNIDSEGDAFGTEAYFVAKGGDYNVITGNGAASGTSSSFVQSYETDSIKGIKAAGAIIIDGGTFSLDTEDDSLHSNGSLTIKSGCFSISSGDDAIHADGAVVIDDGEIEITLSYEGIEGQSIEINGGKISVVSRDDGMNAASGTDGSGFGGRDNGMFAVSEDAYIKVTGGSVTINASGDGIDSNGDLIISGGTLVIYGPRAAPTAL